MCQRSRWLRFVAAAFLLLLWGGLAAAEQVRFHYVATDTCGNTSLRPGGACGSVGERVRWLGMVREPYASQLRPTHLVTFLHPYTGRPITVPLAFPEGTPRIEHVRNKIIYNYGSYTVEAHFLPDGSVDVVYNSGLLRRL